MDRETYNEAMDILDRLEKTIDKAIEQAEAIEAEEESE